MSVNVNLEKTKLTLKGSFEGIGADFMKIFVTFSLKDYNEYICTVETVKNNR